ncbi:MAG TPA: M48 family metalloprotease [Candidatus Sulfotelmatobacter sp.]|jgi:hypothetical protein|nr:M48 family metalloprotease [Candidatus Sulfotelmatobacter sp.]
MFSRLTVPWLGRILFEVFLAGIAAGQSVTPAVPPSNSVQVLPAAPAHGAARFEVLVDSAVRQERRLTILMRNFTPIVETYIQEEKPDSDPGTTPRSDDYFLSRLNLKGNGIAIRVFGEPEGWKEEWEKKLLKNRSPFSAVGFAQAIFPDFDHFDRRNYIFKFVRWEDLGEVHCGVMDVNPREHSQNRGFVGRIWVEDRDFNIVRFTGTYTSKRLTKRAFHFDSWRLNLLGTMWMPAYIYTQESASQDPANHNLWFKAQTRIWGYDLQHAGDHREFAKPLTDTPVWVDPNQHEASQDVSAANTIGKTTYSPEDNIVERLQVAGLMAPHGQVDQILETVVNNLLVTNNIDLAGIRCRVLLTTPLESFVMGRTIVLSRGLLDVLPDEATLAAVLAHELGHIVLNQSVGADSLSGLAPSFSDLEIFARLNFRFDAAQEADADAKGVELLSKSPYQGQHANTRLFLEALQDRSAKLPNLLHGRLGNDFSTSHLMGVPAVSASPDPPKKEPLDQVSALPLGSRITLDPWSDRVTMLKSPRVRLQSASEKMPFEVSPFFPYLKRQEQHEKAQAGTQP